MKERRILEVLAAADRELYGLDLVAAGVARRGSMYVLLARMEERGLIESREEDATTLASGQLPRRVYRITDAGRALLLPTARVRS